MTTLSLAMIAKDEIEGIAAVVADAANFCDEMIVVDTGSSDGTDQAAEAAGARVERFTWIDDFAAARNYSFDCCTGDWVIWLDADDRVVPEVQKGIVALKAELEDRQDLDAVMLEYWYHFRPNDPSLCTFSFGRERLIRREAGLRWIGRVHEVMAVPGGRIMSRRDLHVDHRPAATKRARVGDRNLRILEKAYGDGDRSPRTLFYYGNELRDNGRLQEAMAAYEEYLPVSNLYWERYWALLNLARCARRLGDEDACVKYLLQALAQDSSRAEAFIELGVHHYQRKQWRRALTYFSAAASARKPPDGFVTDDHYSWMPWDYLAVCLARVGRRQEALEAAVKALPGNPERQRIQENLTWLAEQLDSSNRSAPPGAPEVPTAPGGPSGPASRAD